MSPLHGYRVPVEPAEPDRIAADAAPAKLACGPCLYLGPQGQRCGRPAVSGGFCQVHAPGALEPGPWIWFRRFAALLVTAAILWPILEDLLVELSRWRR